MNYKKGFLIAPVILALLTLCIYLTMVLWNWLMPQIFRLPEIGFWQAAGLLVLGRFIFGGFHHKHCWRENHLSYEMRKKIRTMTPEERKEYFHKLHLSREAWHNKYCTGEETSESGSEIK